LDAANKGAGLLQVYNSLTRSLEPFDTVEPGVVRLYVCGVTPYDVGHLGHARTFVAFDTIRRYLEFNALEVRHIQNVTDVDDDMIRKSRELGTTIEALTEKNHAIYLREMDALNVARPEAFPTVTSCIATIVEMVQELLDRGFAYEAEGGH